ncbi:sulfurtransferase TusA family protein [Candidatus Pacearchaeota archaeon]|nr:sulfurtransferase TusA family protein [Candidatus Pacearchaeota archaeon]
MEKLNLKGVVCPINLVRIRVKLDEMPRGDVLEAIVDERFYKDIMGGIEESGYEILSANKQDGTYIITIKNTLEGVA